MTITITYLSGDPTAPVKEKTFENVANPGVFGGAFLQLNENGTNRVMEWIPLARIVNVVFTNNALTGVQLAH